MTQEQLREKLKQIENLSERKEIREIYQSVFEQLALYQEEKIRQLVVIIRFQEIFCLT